MEILQLDISTTLTGLILGISLAAATGFRVFLPLFLLSVAVHFDFGFYPGLATLSPGFEWLGSNVALITLGIATFVEILSYYIPFIDNILDIIAVPLAAIAGTLLVASQLADTPDIVTWSLAIITGGGTASVIAGWMAAVRAASSGATAGTGNFIVTTTETTTSFLMSIVGMLLPLLTFLFAMLLLFWSFRLFIKRRKSRSERS